MQMDKIPTVARHHVRICVRALIVALIVGSALNAINQGDLLIAGQPVVWWKIALTYVVPFLVSAHGALSASARPRAAAANRQSEAAH